MYFVTSYDSIIINVEHGVTASYDLINLHTKV